MKRHLLQSSAKFQVSQINRLRLDFLVWDVILVVRWLRFTQKWTLTLPNTCLMWNSGVRLILFGTLIVTAFVWLSWCLCWLRALNFHSCVWTLIIWISITSSSVWKRFFRLRILQKWIVFNYNVGASHANAETLSHSQHCVNDMFLQRWLLKHCSLHWIAFIACVLS